MPLYVNVMGWKAEGVETTEEGAELRHLFDDVYDQIQDQGGFDIEVIYYSKAMEYLMENDTSLSESMEIAAEMGYTTENINSELLASLLKSHNVRNEFNELREEIDDFFYNLEDDEDEDED